MIRNCGGAVQQVAVLLAASLPLADAGGLTYQHLHSQWQYAHTLTCDAGHSLGACGPSEWIQADGSAACGLAGTQSPIDLDVEGVPAEPTLDANLTFHTNGTCCEGAFLTNEHTTEVKVEETCPQTFYVSRADGKVFYLHQMHFHGPSEHTFGGEYYPMEVHLVHVAADGQALVVSITIAVGEPAGESAERADFMHKVLELTPELPSTAATEDGADVEEPNYAEGVNDFEDLDLYKYMVAGGDNFYHYVGSFTTPPCTTNTLWYIHTVPMVVTQATLDHYRAKIQTSGPDNQLATWGSIVQNQTEDAIPPFAAAAGIISWDPSLGCNNRPIQALHGGAQETRTIMRSMAFHVGELESCQVVAKKDEEEEGKHLFFVIAPVILVVIAGCITRFLCASAKKAATKRSVKAPKAKKQSETAPATTQEMAPLMASPSASSIMMPVAYIAQPQPQAVYYAVPEAQPQQVQYVMMPPSAAQAHFAPASPAVMQPAV